MTNSTTKLGGVTEAEAVQISDALAAASDQKVPHELLLLDAATNLWALVFDINGVDYIATLSKVPKQRKRPGVN